jgi:hypothetical protein
MWYDTMLWWVLSQQTSELRLESLLMKMLRFLGVPSNLASRVSGFFASEARIRPYLWDSSSSPTCEEFVAGGVVECWYDAGVAFAMDCAVLVVAVASPAMMHSSLAVRASASRASRLRWERSTGILRSSTG